MKDFQIILDETVLASIDADKIAVDTVLSLALEQVQQHLKDFANTPDFLAKIQVAFGDKFAPEAAFDLAQKWTEGDVSIPLIEVLPTATLNGAYGGYSGATNTIYLSVELLDGKPLSLVTDTILEEFGHSVELSLNGLEDISGDEGRIFSGLVQNTSLPESELSALKEENDFATILINGEEIEIEQGSVSDSGGFEGSFQTIELDTDGGGFAEFRYEHFTIPDNFIIRYEGENILETGFTGGSETGTVQIPEGDSNQLEVLVATDDEGTAWNYDVETFAPGLNIQDAYVEVAEGSGQTATIKFPVILDESSDVEVSVNYFTLVGTAVDGVTGNDRIDYRPVTDTLTFAPGETSKEIEITVFGDTPVNFGNDSNFEIFARDTAYRSWQKGRDVDFDGSLSYGDLGYRVDEFFDGASDFQAAGLTSDENFFVLISDPVNAEISKDSDAEKDRLLMDLEEFLGGDISSAAYQKASETFNDLQGQDASWSFATGTIYDLGKDPVLAIRGTASGLDAWDDLNPIGIGYDQYINNIGNVNQWLQDVSNPEDTSVSFAPHITGHSLGGALTQWMAADYSSQGALGEVVTFNAPGISVAGADRFAGAEKVTHHITSTDVVSMAGFRYISGQYNLYNQTFSTFSQVPVVGPHVHPVIINSLDRTGETKPSNLSRTNFGSVSSLNSLLFSYLPDPDYFVFLLAVSKIPILGPPVSVALRHRGTAEAARTAIGAALYTVDFAAEFAKEAVQAAWNAAKAWTNAAWDAVAEWGEAAWDAAGNGWEAVAWAATTAWDAAAWAATTTWDAAAWAATTAWDAAAWAATEAWDAAAWAATEAWDAAAWAATEAWDAAAWAATTAWDAAAWAATEAWDAAAWAATEAWDAAAWAATETWNAAAWAATEFWDFVTAPFSASSSELQAAFSLSSPELQPALLSTNLPTVLAIESNTFEDTAISLQQVPSINSGWEATTFWPAEAWAATTQWSDAAWATTAQWSIELWQATTQWPAEIWEATTQWSDDIWQATIQVDDVVGNGLLLGTPGGDILSSGSGNDIIDGLAGNDTLDGGDNSDILRGGAGNDLVTGGAGSDSFAFYSPSEGIDTLQDFDSSEGDRIVVAAVGFGGGLAPDTVLEDDQFVLGTAAINEEDRFIYDQATGNLFFDPDGNGDLPQQQIAVLTGAPSLSAADIFVSGSSTTPTIKLTAPSTDVTGSEVIIAWNAFDADSEATISLFYDTDRQGVDGVLIAADLAETDGAGSFVWNTETVPQEDYFIYAVVDDGINSPAFSYAKGQVQLAPTSEADLSVTQTVSAASVGVGESFTYTIEVINNGSVTSEGVVLVDTLPETVTFVAASLIPSQQTDNIFTFDLGDLAAGESQTVEIEVVAPAFAEIVTSSAVATSNTIDPDQSNDIANVSTDITAPELPDLVVTRTGNTNPVSLRDPYDYTLTVTNNGSAEATGVVLTETLPSTAEVIGATASTPGLEINLVDLVEFQLDAGERVTLDIDARIMGSPLDSVLRLFDSAGNELAVSDDNPAPDEFFSRDSYIDFTALVDGTYYAGVSGFSNFSYNPLVDGSGASSSSSGDYELEIQIGSGGSINQVVLDEPNNIIPQAVDSGLSSDNPGTFIGTGFIRTDTNPLSIANGIITVNLGNLDVDESATVDVTLSSFAAGNLIGTINATSNEPDANPLDNLIVSRQTVNSIVPTEIDLELTQTISDTNPAIGDQITLTLTLTNQGPGTSTSIEVRDILPTQLEFISASTVQGTYDSSTGIWDVGNMRDNLTRTLTIDALVVAAGSVGNTAEVIAVTEFDVDSTPGNGFEDEDDQDTVVITVDAPNTTPVAANDSFTVAEDTVLTGSVAENDTDTEGDATYALDEDADNGTVNLNLDGTFTYTPDADFFGSDSFSYTLSDEEFSSSATVNITVNKDVPVVALDIGLYDADTDTLIATLGDNIEVLASEIFGRDITIAALVPDGSPFSGEVESMVLNLNEGQVVKTENIEPYALFGDNNGNFRGQDSVFDIGSNAITFNLYSENRGQGDLLAIISQSFTVVDDLTGAVGLSVGLYDADTDALITTLSDGDTVLASDIADRNLTLAAFLPNDDLASGLVESIVLNLNEGQVVKTENVEPYALFGDNNGDFRGNAGILSPGANSIDLDLYSLNRARGELLQSEKITFSVVETLG